MPAPKKKEEELPKFWFPNDTEGYVLGEVLHQDASDNMHVRLQLPEGEAKTANFHASVAKPGEPEDPRRRARQHAADAPARAVTSLQPALPLWQGPHLHLHRLHPDRGEPIQVSGVLR